MKDIPRHVIEGSTSSIQGMMEDFMQSPALLWVNNESAQLLRDMTEGKTATQLALRDSYNELFDANNRVTSLKD